MPNEPEVSIDISVPSKLEKKASRKVLIADINLRHFQKLDLEDVLDYLDDIFDEVKKSNKRLKKIMDKMGIIE